MSPLLELDGVQARYVHRTVLRGVDLTVGAGEMVALVGPNGAGKSTVLKTVFGLTELTGGRLLLAGELLPRPRPSEMLRRGVAYLPQGGQVFAPLTVVENLVLAARLSPLAGRPDIDAALAPFEELSGRRRQPAGTLSGGQKQQLALAMALLGRPRLLLADEPSIGLAAPLAARAVALLAEVARDRGAGVLLVEQNVPLALAVADRLVLLSAGRAVAQATAAEVAANPALHEQFTLGLEPETAGDLVDT